VLKYTGYKLKDGDKVNSDFLDRVLVKKTTWWSGWTFSTHNYRVWDRAAICKRVFFTEIFQELLNEKKST
jgi:hypothetical protein